MAELRDIPGLSELDYYDIADRDRVRAAAREPFVVAARTQVAAPPPAQVTAAA